METLREVRLTGEMEREREEEEKNRDDIQPPGLSSV